MKKLIAPLLTVALLAGCSSLSNEASAPAAMMDGKAMPMMGGKGMDMMDNGKCPMMKNGECPMMDKGAMPMMDKGAMPMMGEGSAAAGALATGTGTIESVDPAAGKIVIAHGPVEALKWPAMTMGFTATPEQIQAVQPGQKVTFDFNSKGSNNTITRIEPAQ